jgi:hypothetical protein
VLLSGAAARPATKLCITMQGRSVRLVDCSKVPGDRYGSTVSSGVARMSWEASSQRNLEIWDFVLCSGRRRKKSPDLNTPGPTALGSSMTGDVQAGGGKSGSKKKKKKKKRISVVRLS